MQVAIGQGNVFNAGGVIGADGAVPVQLGANDRRRSPTGCPINIDVRRHAWLGVDIEDSYCLTCGQCVERCPRGVLRFERTRIFLQRDE